MCIDTERENGGSINFIFTLLPSPTLDKTYRLLPCSSQENDAAYDVLINSNFLWIANSLKVSTFACFGPISFVSHMYVCVRQVLLFNCNIAIATYIWEFLLYEHNGGGGGGGFIFRNANFNFLCMVGLYLLFSSAHFQITSAATVKLLIMLALFVH